MTAPRPKLDIDVTREKLTALGCGYAAAALKPLLAEAVRSELAAHPFLKRLLDGERAGREERRIRAMLRSAPCARHRFRVPSPKKGRVGGSPCRAGAPVR